VGITSTSKDVSGSANITLFDGLANINRIGAARASRDAAELNRAWSRELVIQNVATAYYDLLRYVKLREVAVETRDQARAELERTETYFRLGSAAKSEVLQQRVRLEQTRYDLVVADNMVEMAAADLAYAMNQPLAERVAIDTSPLFTEMALEEVDSLYSEALESRLDLESSRLGVEASQHEARAASGALLPRVDAFGRFSRSNNESPYRFGSQTSESWVFGAQASWDIFNRYQNWTNRSKAKAQARIAEYQMQQAELDAQLEVRQYHNAMRNALEKHKVSEETIVQAEEELRLAKERFRVGAGTQLDRITAEVNLASARADEVQAVCDYLIARVQLYRAVGRLNNLGS
jgi:outer membrane protein TolC